MQKTCAVAIRREHAQRAQHVRSDGSRKTAAGSAFEPVDKSRGLGREDVHFSPSLLGSLLNGPCQTLSMTEYPDGIAKAMRNNNLLVGGVEARGLLSSVR